MPDRLDELLADPTIESLFEHPNEENVGFDGPPKHPGRRFDLKCGECGSTMVLQTSKKFPNPFYGCSQFPECRGTHGAHPDGTPLGTPANKETKSYRMWAHSVFDQIWKQKLVTHRGAAYNWMRQVMGLTNSQAHIAMFNQEQCETLVRLVYRDYPKLRNRRARLLYGRDILEELGGEPEATAMDPDAPEQYIPEDVAAANDDRPNRWNDDRDVNDFV